MSIESRKANENGEEWKLRFQSEKDAWDAALAFIYDSEVGADISNFDAAAVIEKLSSHPLKDVNGVADQYYNHVSYLAFEAFDYPDRVEGEYLQASGYERNAAESILDAALRCAPQQCLDEHLRHCSDKHFDRLIAQGADPESFSEYGQNALHKAAEREDKNRVARLIEGGMDPATEQRGAASREVSFSPEISEFMTEYHRSYHEHRSLEKNTAPVLSLPNLSDPEVFGRMADQRIASPKRPMRL